MDAAELLGKLPANLETSPADDGSGPDQTPPDPAETTMAMTTCIPASAPGIAEPEWLPGGQDLRDVALQLRLLLSRGIPVAIATVVGARGTEVRRPGTVVVITGSGQAIGFNPAGPLDGAIRDLAAKALTTGRAQLQRLEIDKDAASYIGLAGDVSLDVHAMHVPAGDPAFGGALRHLDSGAAAVMVIGTRGLSGYAVIGADRITADPSWPQLPPAVIEDARAMLGSRHTVRRTYRSGGDQGCTGIEVWMQSHPEAEGIGNGKAIQEDVPGCGGCSGR